MKCFYGSAMQNRRDFREMIEIAPVAGDQSSGIAAGPNAEGGRITRAALVGVICERLNLLMSEINAALAGMGFAAPTGRQVVLTGGGAELKGIADYAQGALGRAVRIGRPRGLSALPEAHSGPAFATLAGLALYGASNPVDLRTMAPSQQTVHKVGAPIWWQRMMRAIKTNY
jgi:cell division protein FtsA